MKELTLQIKPVGNNCNLNCSYCYASPFKRKKFSILGFDELEKIIKEALELSDNVIVSWHGGEPTMVGIDYFEKYVDIVNKYISDNQKVVNMIQTNATLIDDDLAEFFKKNNFIVSVSLDGDEQSHNKNRLNYNMQGSFESVMKGINTLRKHGINPPVIATVSKSTYNDGVRNFEFFVQNDFKEIKYSPVYDSIDDNFSISDDMWFEYLKRIFYKWLEYQDPEIKVREIDEILMWFAKKSTCLCSNRNMCSKWISIDEIGDIYPCEYLRHDNPYGNIRNIQLKDVFKSQSYIDFKDKISYRPEKCANCELLSLCHNGCPATRVKKDRLSYDGTYVYCNQRKALYAEIKKIINS